MTRLALWSPESLLAILVLVILAGRPSAAPAPYDVWAPNPYYVPLGFLANLSDQGCAKNSAVFTGERFMAVSNGSRVTMYPQLRGQPTNATQKTYDPTVAFTMQVVALEQLATTSAPPLCATDLDQSFQYVPLSDCTICGVTTWIDNSNASYTDTYHSLSMTNCSATNNFTIVVNISTTDIDHYTYYTDPSDNETVQFFHPASGVKFGIEIYNWNWTENTTPGNYLAGRLQCSFTGVGNTSFTLFNESDEYCFDLVDSGYNTTICFERYFVLDTSLSYGLPPPPLGTIPFGLSQTTEVVYMDQNFSFCPPFPTPSANFPKPNYVFYDPTLQFLFDADSAPISPSEPPATFSPQSNDYWKTVVGVTVPVVLVIIFATAALVLLFIYVPAVKHFFRPYSKPQRGVLINNVHDDTQTSPKSSEASSSKGWSQAKKPATE